VCFDDWVAEFAHPGLTGLHPEEKGTERPSKRKKSSNSGPASMESRSLGPLVPGREEERGNQASLDLKRMGQIPQHRRLGVLHLSRGLRGMNPGGRETR